MHNMNRSRGSTMLYPIDILTWMTSVKNKVNVQIFTNLWWMFTTPTKGEGQFGERGQCEMVNYPCMPIMINWPLNEGDKPQIR